MMHFRICIYLLFILSLSSVSSQDQRKYRPKICLNMIVKNESEIITRCLASVLPIIDYWVIVDTGSTDGTQDVIKEYMYNSGVEGELYERPWVNFAHNRNEALMLASGKGDYTLFIDADDYLSYAPGFTLPNLNKGYYYISIEHSGLKYSRILLVNNKFNWKWNGVVHEVLTPPASCSYATLNNVTCISTTDGARAKDPQRFLKDAEILEAELEKHPYDTRTAFYLAQSYNSADEYELALKGYEKRVQMGGWDQEVFYSLLQIGLMQESLDMPRDTIINSYIRAFNYRPSRVEPLYYMAYLYRTNEEYNSGYAIAKLAQNIAVSKDVLFVHKWMHDYGIALELSICAYWTGKYEECQSLSLDLLRRDDLPENVRSCVETNLRYANAKLTEKLHGKSREG